MEENTLTELKLREKYQYVPRRKEDLSLSIKKRLQCNKTCWINFIFKFVPILTWLPKYRFRENALSDLIAGLTVSVVRIPQGLAYGLLAGLYPINGLYTGFFSPLVYMVFGTSRHISVGVFSVVSLMLGAALNKVNIDPSEYFTPSVPPSSTSTNAFIDTTTGASTFIPETSAVPSGYTDEQNLAIIGALTVLIGLLLIGLGICRLGIVAMFLSDPLVSGFTTGAAIYVVTAQLKYITGIALQRRSGLFSLIKTYIEVFSRLNEIHWPSVIISVICLLILVPLKYVNRTYKKKLRNIPIPVELFIVVLGTSISYGANLQEKYNVRVIGDVPSGMPAPVLPMASLWPVLIGDAISIAMVIFAISVSLGKMFGKKHGYQIDPNQELIALGLCQMTNGFFQGHAGGGALARSIVQESSGGKTELVGLVSSSVLLLVLLVIGPVFQYLPLACLSCIILANLHGLLIQFQILPKLWKIDRNDFFVWLLTFTAVICLGVDLGLAVGVVISLCITAIRSYKIKTKHLVNLPGSLLYRDAKRFQEVSPLPHVKIIQFPESPTYANKNSMLSIPSDVLSRNDRVVEIKQGPDASFVNDETTLAITDDELGKDIKIVVLDCSAWTFIDTVGLSTLKQVFEELNSHKISIFLTSLQEEVYDKLDAYDLLGNKDLNVIAYPDIDYAVKAARISLSMEDRNSESSV